MCLADRVINSLIPIFCPKEQRPRVSWQQQANSLLSYQHLQKRLSPVLSPQHRTTLEPGRSSLAQPLLPTQATRAHSTFQLDPKPAWITTNAWLKIQL